MVIAKCVHCKQTVRPRERLRCTRCTFSLHVACIDKHHCNPSCCQHFFSHKCARLSEEKLRESAAGAGWRCPHCQPASAECRVLSTGRRFRRALAQLRLGGFEKFAKVYVRCRAAHGTDAEAMYVEIAKELGEATTPNEMKLRCEKFLYLYMALLKLLVGPHRRAPGEAARRGLRRAPGWLRAVERELNLAPAALKECKGAGWIKQAEAALSKKENLVKTRSMYAALSALAGAGGSARALVELAQEHSLELRDLAAVWEEFKALCMTKLQVLAPINTTPDELRMTPTEWATCDAVLRDDNNPQQWLVYEASPRGESLLARAARAARMFRLEAPAARDLRARRWAAALAYYRMSFWSSLLVLQRRWYELKREARRSVEAFRRSGRAPAPLLASIVASYPDVITKPFPSWRELVLSGQVVEATEEEISKMEPVDPMSISDVDAIPPLVPIDQIKKNTKLNVRKHQLQQQLDRDLKELISLKELQNLDIQKHIDDYETALNKIFEVSDANASPVVTSTTKSINDKSYPNMSAVSEQNASDLVTNESGLESVGDIVDVKMAETIATLDSIDPENAETSVIFESESDDDEMTIRGGNDEIVGDDGDTASGDKINEGNADDDIIKQKISSDIIEENIGDDIIKEKTDGQSNSEKCDNECLPAEIGHETNVNNTTVVENGSLDDNNTKSKENTVVEDEVLTNVTDSPNVSNNTSKGDRVDVMLSSVTNAENITEVNSITNSESAVSENDKETLVALNMDKEDSKDGMTDIQVSESNEIVQSCAEIGEDEIIYRSNDQIEIEMTLETTSNENDIDIDKSATTSHITTKEEVKELEKPNSITDLKEIISKILGNTRKNETTEMAIESAGNSNTGDDYDDDRPLLKKERDRLDDTDDDSTHTDDDLKMASDLTSDMDDSEDEVPLVRLKSSNRGASDPCASDGESREEMNAERYSQLSQHTEVLIPRLDQTPLWGPLLRGPVNLRDHDLSWLPPPARRRGGATGENDDRDGSPPLSYLRSLCKPVSVRVPRISISPPPTPPPYHRHPTNESPDIKPNILDYPLPSTSELLSLKATPFQSIPSAKSLPKRPYLTIEPLPWKESHHTKVLPSLPSLDDQTEFGSNPTLEAVSSAEELPGLLKSMAEADRPVFCCEARKHRMQNDERWLSGRGLKLLELGSHGSCGDACRCCCAALAAAASWPELRRQRARLQDAMRAAVQRPPKRTSDSPELVLTKRCKKKKREKTLPRETEEEDRPAADSYQEWIRQRNITNRFFSLRPPTDDVIPPKTPKVTPFKSDRTPAKHDVTPCKNDETPTKLVDTPTKEVPTGKYSVLPAPPRVFKIFTQSDANVKSDKIANRDEIGECGKTGVYTINFDVTPAKPDGDALLDHNYAEDSSKCPGHVIDLTSDPETSEDIEKCNSSQMLGDLPDLNPLAAVKAQIAPMGTNHVTIPGQSQYSQTTNYYMYCNNQENESSNNITNGMSSMIILPVTISINAPQIVNPNDQMNNQKKVVVQTRNQMENKLGNQMYNQFGNQLGNQVSNQIESQLGNQIENKLGNQTYNQIGNQVGNQMESKLGNQMYNYNGNLKGNQSGYQMDIKMENQIGDQMCNQLGNQIVSQPQSGNQPIMMQVTNQPVISNQPPFMTQPANATQITAVMPSTSDAVLTPKVTQRVIKKVELRQGYNSLNELIVMQNPSSAASSGQELNVAQTREILRQRLESVIRKGRKKKRQSIFKEDFRKKMVHNLTRMDADEPEAPASGHQAEEASSFEVGASLPMISNIVSLAGDVAMETHDAGPSSESLGPVLYRSAQSVFPAPSVCARAVLAGAHTPPFALLRMRARRPAWALPTGEIVVTDSGQSIGRAHYYMIKCGPAGPRPARLRFPRAPRGGGGGGAPAAGRGQAKIKVKSFAKMPVDESSSSEDDEAAEDATSLDLVVSADNKLFKKLCATPPIYAKVVTGLCSVEAALSLAAAGAGLLAYCARADQLVAVRTRAMRVSCVRKHVAEHIAARFNQVLRVSGSGGKLWQVAK